MKSLQRIRNLLAGTVPAGSVLGTTGVVWLAIAFWNFTVELSGLDDFVFPVTAFLITGSLASAVVFAGYRLTKSQFDAVERWSITGWAFAGLGVALLLQMTTLAIRAAEGRMIGEPQFPLLVVGSVGALAGYGIGSLLVDVRRTAAAAQEARDGMAFANSLLRHDVRNALQVIVGQTGVVADIDDERARTASEAIESQVDALFELTENADAVARVLANEASPEPRDIVADVDSAVATVRESFPDATIEVDVHDTHQVLGTDALGPVFTNIINNAVQHTGDTPTVRITSMETDESVIIDIADDGPGIPEAERERIFERGVTTDGGSNGLGLHIVSTLVERSGGSIHVESSELGGATFVVELPRPER